MTLSVKINSLHNWLVHVKLVIPPESLYPVRRFCVLSASSNSNDKGATISITAKHLHDFFVWINDFWPSIIFGGGNGTSSFICWVDPSLIISSSLGLCVTLEVDKHSRVSIRTSTIDLCLIHENKTVSIVLFIYGEVVIFGLVVSNLTINELFRKNWAWRSWSESFCWP